MGKIWILGQAIMGLLKKYFFTWRCYDEVGERLSFFGEQEVYGLKYTLALRIEEMEKWQRRLFIA